MDNYSLKRPLLLVVNKQMGDLLKLWLLSTEQLSITEIANELNVSTKQAARKLKQYEQQGWITYIPGQGRGNKSQILWHKNVKQIIQQNMAEPKFRLKMLKEMNVELLSNKFVTEIMSHLFSLKQKTHSLIIPIYKTEIKTDPLQLLDTESAWVMMHIYSRLIDENGCGDLAYHWEQRDDAFVFFIRPSLYWHNGEIMTNAQIVASLKNSFQYESYKFARCKLKGLTYDDNCIVIKYDGDLVELLHVLAQVEFSIQYNGLSSGAFNIQQVAVDQYELQLNPHYYLAKPILTTILLQTIPSEFIRKASLVEAEPHDWVEKLEHSGTVYLYYKTGMTAEVEQQLCEFFMYFANEVGRLDKTKIPINKTVKTPLKCPTPLNVGFVVNKSHFVNLLKELSTNTNHVNHLTVTDLQELEPLMAYDCLIVPLHEGSKLPVVHALDSLFTKRLPLYESYRKMIYPKSFIRKGHDIYGYPNLKESYVLDL